MWYAHHELSICSPTVVDHYTASFDYRWDMITVTGSRAAITNMENWSIELMMDKSTVCNGRRFIVSCSSLMSKSMKWRGKWRGFNDSRKKTLDIFVILIIPAADSQQESCSTSSAISASWWNFSHYLDKIASSSRSRVRKIPQFTFLRPHTASACGGRWGKTSMTRESMIKLANFHFNSLHPGGS